MTSTIANSKGKKNTNIWNVMAVALVLVATVSWRLIDVVFVIAFLTLIYQEWRYQNWVGIKLVVTKTKLVSLFIFTWLAATILGYFLTVKVGPVQIEEILGLRWIFAFYISIYIGTRLDFDEKVFKYTIVAMAALLLLGVPWQYLYLKDFGRYYGTYGNSNVYAAAIALPWGYLLAWESYQYEVEKKNNLWLIGVLLVLTGLIFFTYSRGTWISLVLVYLAVTVLLRSKRNIFCFLGFVVVASISFQTNLFKIKDRVLYSFDLSTGSSQGIRLNLWKTNWAIFMDHPIFGVGFYENLRLLPAYYAKLGIDNRQDGVVFIGHAHNQFLQILVGSGFVGFCAWFTASIFGLLYFYRWFSKATTRLQSKVGFSGLIVVLIFLGNCIVESPFMLSYVRGFLFMLVGFSVGFLVSSERS